MRDFHLPGRSVSMGLSGAAATSHQQATLAAIEVMRSGGNAIDAAVAASALLGVIEPHSTGIGGDCFVLVWSAQEQKLYGLNGSGHAPACLSADWLRGQGETRVPADSVHSVTVPGAVRSWETLLSRFGTRSLGDVLQPAIEAADKGSPVAERIAWDWAMFAPNLRNHQASRDQLLLDGRAPRAGTVMRYPILANTLRAIAADGADVFYKGQVATDMIATLNALGGRHEVADFADWRPRWVEPVRIDYRGTDVYQIPPNGQGVTAAMMLNILKGFDHSHLDPQGAERFHLQIEAYRLAAAARDAYIADPEHGPVPTETLFSETLADAMRARINPRRAMADPVPEPLGPTDTVCLTTADAEGNFVSFINSIAGAFGSFITCPRTGVLFQNRGGNFSLAKGHPNELAPRKRSLNTIIPGFATRNGKPFLSFGVMHGFYQPIGQVQVLQNIVDFGMDVQQAIDMGRGMRTKTGFEAERSVPNATLAGLMQRGHPVLMADMAWGGGQAIMPINGVLHAGSDSRKDGLALAF